MATWKQRGVTTPVQLWDPDYSFLTKVYSTQQARYDRGFNAVKSVYNSFLNGALTNEGNEAYRSEVFKRLEETLKSTSALDLSKSENISTAIGILDPIAKDQDIAYDMAITRFHDEEKSKMESYRNSSDPEKRIMYNDYSKMAIGFAEEDLRGAKRGDGSIRAVSPQNFVPFQDINEYLNTQAKEAGLVIKTVDAKGGYILEQENGQDAVIPFTAWAQQQMQGRFDEQLGLIGKVQAETAIRGTMKTQGVSRNDATQIVASKVTPDYAKKNYETTVKLNKNLGVIEEEIKMIDENYPDGIPVNMPHLGERYQELLYQRDNHKTLVDGGTEKMNRLESEKAEYVAQNLYGVFTEEATLETAMGWGGTRAIATAKMDLKADQTWIAKQNNAIKMKIHNQNMQFKTAELGYRKNKDAAQLELDWYKALNSGSGSGTGGSGGGNSATGEDQTSAFKGYFTSDSTKSKVDILDSRMNQNYGTMWNNVTKANNGLMSLIVPTENFNMANTAMSKVKQIADGNKNVVFTDEEAKYLDDYGTQIGYTFNAKGVQGQPKYGKEMMLAISMGTYEVAQEKVQLYSKTGTIPDNITNMDAFANTLSSMQSIVEDEDAINRSLNNIAQVITDDRGNIREEFEGAYIEGYNSDGVPIYNIKKLSDEAKASLDAVVAGEFDALTAPIGQTISYSGLSAGEIEALFNNNMGTVFDSDGETTTVEDAFGNIVDLPDDQIAKLFSDKMDVSYDIINEEAIVELNIDPTSAVAKTMDLGTGSYKVKIPYETIKANAYSMPRLYQGVQGNEGSNQGAGNFTEFISNPNARVQSESWMDAAGFSYDVAGVNYDNSDGQNVYGLNIITKHYDPIANKYITSTYQHPILNPGDPTAFNEVNDLINGEYQKYMSSLGLLKEVENEIEKYQYK